MDAGVLWFDDLRKGDNQGARHDQHQADGRDAEGASGPRMLVDVGLLSGVRAGRVVGRNGRVP